MGEVKLFNKNIYNEIISIPNNYYDLSIIDPPYEIADNPSRHGSSGAGKLRNRILNKSAVKFKSWDKRPDNEFFKQLFRISKNQIIFGGNYFNLPPTRGIICWDKMQPWKNFSQFELIWTSFKYPASIIRIDNRTGDKIHPTQKPVLLYKQLLAKYAKQNFKIIDTHAGSFSLGIAAIQLNMKLTIHGFEIDKQYFDAATKRLIREQAQLKMF